MKTKNTELELCTQEVSIQLYYLGFNYSCVNVFPKIIFNEKIYINQPSQSLVVKYFRDVYKLFIETSMYVIQEGEYDGCYAFKSVIKNIENYKEKIIYETKNHPTFEKAELQSILKIIEIKKK